MFYEHTNTHRRQAPATRILLSASAPLEWDIGKSNCRLQYRSRCIIAKKRHYIRGTKCTNNMQSCFLCKEQSRIMNRLKLSIFTFNKLLNCYDYKYLIYVMVFKVHCILHKNGSLYFGNKKIKSKWICKNQYIKSERT